MKTTLKLTIAMFKIFVRNKQALIFTLVSPLLIMVIFGMIGFDKPQKFSIGIASINPQPQTIQFIEQLKQFPSFEITLGTKDENLAKLKNGDFVAVLDIPSDFFNITDTQSEPKTITVYSNASQAAQAQTVVSVLNQYLSRATMILISAPTLFTLQQESIDSKNLKYIDFLLPGLVAMSVMQMSVFSVAFLFAQYKEKGVLKRLLATPMKAYQFVAANSITRLLVSVIQAFIFIGVGVLMLHVHVEGSMFLVLLCVILGALMFLGLGFTISGIAKTVESVPAIANLTVFPMMFLGGTFFPISSMPDWLQKFAQFLPLTFFSTPLRAIMTESAGFSKIKGDLLGMLIWSAILITLATITFRFQEREG